MCQKTSCGHCHRWEIYSSLFSDVQIKAMADGKRWKGLWCSNQACWYQRVNSDSCPCRRSYQNVFLEPSLHSERQSWMSKCCFNLKQFKKHVNISPQMLFHHQKQECWANRTGRFEPGEGSIPRLPIIAFSL